MRSSIRIKSLLFLILGVLTSCVREQPQVIVITATFPAAPVVVVQGDVTPTPQAAVATPVPVNTLALSPVPDNIVLPTLDATQSGAVENATEHIVQSGDTLFEIAQQYNVSLDALLSANNIENPDILTVGQLLILPDTPVEQTIAFKLIPDSRLVRAPGSGDFDIAVFINQQPGYIRQVTDNVDVRVANGAALTRTQNAAQVIEQISLQYSVDARVLLALLEYSAGWLSNPAPSEDLKSHPLLAAANSGGVDRSGLYRQLAWAADQLNTGYYAWKYRGLRTLSFSDGARLSIADGLNAGTIALQYYFSRFTAYAEWLQKVDAAGFFQVYFSYFGNPFDASLDTPINTTLQQPPLTYPFAAGEIWYYTGGHHGGWGTRQCMGVAGFCTPG